MTHPTVPLVALTLSLLLTACSTRTETSRLSADVSEVARQHAVACDLGEAVSCYGLAHLYAGDRDERHHGLPYDPASVERLLTRACQLDRAFGCDGFRDHQILQETGSSDSAAPHAQDATLPSSGATIFPTALVDRLESTWAPLVRACTEGTATDACPHLAWGLTTGVTLWSNQILTTEERDPTGGFQVLVRQCDAGHAAACFFASRAQRRGVEPIPADEALARHLWRRPLRTLVQGCEHTTDPENAACKHLVFLLAEDADALPQNARATLMQSLCDAGLLAACTLDNLQPADSAPCAAQPDDPRCVPARIAQVRARPAPRNEARRTLWQEAGAACAAAIQEATDTATPRSPWCQLRDELAESIGETPGEAECLVHGAALGMPPGICPGEIPLLPRAVTDVPAP